MAALAPSLLEAAAVALARALGWTAAAAAGAGAINEAAKKKDEAAEKSKELPIAQAGTQAKARSGTCTKCPPDCGTLVERNWNMSEDARAYQARITGFLPYTEWSFEGTDFDGFRSQMCLLLEAKARYDQFFDEEGDPKFFFSLVGEPRVLAQGFRQSAVARANPPSRIHWHFMQPVSFGYFSRSFSKAFLAIQCFLTP